MQKILQISRMRENGIVNGGICHFHTENIRESMTDELVLNPVVFLGS